MAKVAKKSNHLKGDLYIEYLTLILLFAVGMASLITTFIITPFAIIGMGAAFIYIKIILRRIKILKFGLEGEKEVLQTLRKLPKRYTILSDVLIVDGNKSSQIDFVVIGSNGLFIIESKHVKGTINGNVDDTYLNKVKVTSGGKNTYSKKMYNPIIQILGHKKGIAKFLKSYGFTYDIIPIVYFSSDVKVNIKSDKVELITNENQLLKYIKKYKKENINIEGYTQKEISQILKKC